VAGWLTGCGFGCGWLAMTDCGWLAVAGWLTDWLAG